MTALCLVPWLCTCDAGRSFLITCSLVLCLPLFMTLRHRSLAIRLAYFFPRLPTLGPLFESHWRYYVNWIFSLYLIVWVFQGIIPSSNILNFLGFITSIYAFSVTVCSGFHDLCIIIGDMDSTLLVSTWRFVIKMVCKHKEPLKNVLQVRGWSHDKVLTDTYRAAILVMSPVCNHNFQW